jgi:hypothetical protein
MDKLEVRATIEVTADCGHKFKVPVAGLDAETDLVCPECGAVDHFNAEQIADIQAKFDTALREAATKHVADQLGDALGKAIRGKKGVTYRRH